MPDGRLTLTVALALASAIAFAVATVAQQRAAARSSDLEARGRGFLLQLLRRPQWWAGTIGNGGGYALQAIALGYGSLLVVQPILATSLLFALPLGARLSHLRLGRSVWVWGFVLAVALASFVTLGHPDSGAARTTGTSWLIVAAIGLPVVVGCLAVAQRREGAPRASLLAVADGLLAGALAVLTKAVVAAVPDGVTHLLGMGETYGLIVVGLSGVYLQQLAFQAGALPASLPIINVLEPMTAAVFGVTMLHEHLHANGLRLVVLALAVVLMTLATVALARSEAQVLPDR